MLSRRPVSVFELKRGFLMSQAQLLAQPLSLNQELQGRSGDEDHQDISRPTLEQVATKVNAASRKHHQLVYSSVAIRHVAEQLDALYAESSSDSTGLDIDKIFTNGLDLTNIPNLEVLPDNWVDDVENEELEKLQKYCDLVANLSTVRSALVSLRDKHTYYAMLVKSVAPFADPTENIQPNLVTRSGALALELNKTRILASRLSQALSSAPQTK